MHKNLRPARGPAVCASLHPMTYDDFVAAQRALADEYSFGYYEAALRSWIATVAIVEVGYVGEWGSTPTS
jgi:hypothetical protein